MSRKLFFTLEGILRAMDRHEVSDEDLQHGLYALDCTKEHVMRPWEPYGGRDTADTNELERVFAGREQAARIAHQKLRDMLGIAHGDGRVTWLESDTDWHDGESLNRFLESNGLGRPLDPDDVYDAAGLEIALQSTGIDIQVIG